MENTESDSASLGPRYAPEDPSLPKPWKGLIDGSSGVLYYWNPETNVTQYEKPASLPPPLPPGQPPSAPAPKLAPIPVPVPRSFPQTTTIPQNGDQMVSQVPHQQGHQMPHQQGPHPGPATMQHAGLPGPQTYQSQVAPPLMHQHMQYMPYQQSVFPQGNHRQEFNPVFPKKEEDGFQSRNQTGFSPAAQSQNVGPAGANSAQMRPVPPPQQLNGNSNNMQPPNPMGQLQPRGPDLGNNPHGRFQAERGAPVVHNQQSNIIPPGGLRTGHESNFHGRGGNEYAFSSDREAPIGGPQQPQLGAIPTARTQQQDSRFSGVPYPNATPGHTVPNMHGHPTGGPPFLNNTVVKPTYFGSQDVSSFSSVESYRQQHEVSATGDNVPAPFMTFESTGFPPEILREFSLVAGAISAPEEEHMSYAALMYSAGFSTPTPIQAQTWPIALQSRDIVAIAKTGSGKTLGYLIPGFILLRQRRNNPLNGPTVLVLAPTRELATQIQDEAIKFGRSSRVSCTCLYGGASKGAQLKELDRGADIVVATPGRLNDILEMKKIDFRQVSLLVLDEADRMLDMGFEPQIRKIVNEIPPRRQTLMFTATWPKEVRKIAADLLVSPVQVNIGNADELSANKAITQYVEVVPPMEKQRRLEQILRSQERGSKVIIFCSTKRLCDQIARSIGRNFGAAAIHGDKSQGERDWVLNQFRCGKSPVLVATDVAARGLDIKDIRVVINYDFPTGVEDYVHRIGRTGRAGATGMAYTFFSEQDWKYAAELIKVLEGANQRVPQEVRDIAMRGGPGFGKDRYFDSGSRGGGGFGGRGGGARDSNFGGRGRDHRDGGGAVTGYGGRGDFSGGRGGGRGFGAGGPEAGRGGFGRNDRVGPDRFMDGGRGRGRSRGRFDNRRDSGGGRVRDRSYSRSPERVRTWGYTRSQSRSRSRSRSWSRSRSRSRSWSRGRNQSRSRSRSRSPKRIRNRSSGFDRRDGPPKQMPEQKVPGPGITDREASEPAAVKEAEVAGPVTENAVSEVGVIPEAGEQSS